MRDGTVLLVKSDPNAKCFQKVYQWFIKKITGKDIVHAKIYFQGSTWELAPPKVMRHDGIAAYDIAVEPRFNAQGNKVSQTIDSYLFTPAQIARCNQWLDGHKNDKYSYVKLVLMVIIIPLRTLWRVTGWVPGGSPYDPANDCSQWVENMYREGLGIELFPSDPNGYTAPGDFLDSWYLGEVESD